jgi:hypothetical protein
MLLTLEVPASKAEVTVSSGTVESPSFRPCPENRQTRDPVWNYVSHWSIPFPCIYFFSADLYPRNVGLESSISISILSRSINVWTGTETRKVNRLASPYKLLGRCVLKKVGDLVGDLSVPRPRTSSSSLIQGTCSF